MAPATHHVEPVRRAVRFVLAGGALSILEGMAAGRVVLAAHHTPAKRATLQAFAAACPPLLLADSAAALAEEVLALVARPARERSLIAEGLELTRRHTWERVCAEYLGLWRRAAP